MTDKRGKRYDTPMHDYLDTAEGRGLLQKHGLRRTLSPFRSLDELTHQNDLHTLAPLYPMITFYERGIKGVFRPLGYAIATRDKLEVFHKHAQGTDKNSKLKTFADELAQKLNIPVKHLVIPPT